MDKDRQQKILDLIARLTKEVSVAREYSLDHAASLLQMANLELQMIAHEISESELRTFSSLLAQLQDRRNPTGVH
jgi:hypothetical protein